MNADESDSSVDVILEDLDEEKLLWVCSKYIQRLRRTMEATNLAW